MEDFLLKSTLSLAFLFAIYYLVLEKEKMHNFNRFFLLFSLLFSLAIPFITIEVEVYQKIVPVKSPVIVEQMPMQIPVFAKESTDYLPMILWSLYSAITLILALRFFSNLYKIKNRIKASEKESFGNATLVLVNQKILPHTFLNYIFINKEDYKNRNIEEELYTHELTHAKQKHTVDVLFIEFLKTLFWFNPILILYKKAMQLNHEFLADEKVVTSHNNVPFYQNLLLEKASWNNTFYLVSNLNFSVTKKRLIMMTKTTSRSRALLKKILLLPVLALLVFVSCLQTTAAESQPEVWVNGTKVKDSEMNKPISYWQKNHINEATYFAGVRFLIYKNGIQTKTEIIGKDIVFDKLYEELTPEDKERVMIWLYMIKGFKKISPTQKELDGFKNAKSYAIWIDGVNVKNTELNKFKPSDIAYFSGSVILKNARTKKHPQPFQYWFYTHEYFDKNEMGKDQEKYAGDKIEIFEKITKKA